MIHHIIYSCLGKINWGKFALIYTLYFSFYVVRKSNCVWRL